MEQLIVEPRERQKAELQGPSDAWPIGGYTFLGGTVEVADAAGMLEDLDYGRLRRPPMRIVLGSLALASAGTKNREIVEDLKALLGEPEKVSTDDVNHIIMAVNHEIGIARRYRLLPELLRQRIFSIGEYGQPDDFRATPYELARIGLVARGVEWGVIAAACGNAEGTLSNHLSKMSRREGVHGSAGCIAGGILTRQLGAVSCVPRLHSDREPRQFWPIMPIKEWEDLVHQQDPGALAHLFTELEAL